MPLDDIHVPTPTLDSIIADMRRIALAPDFIVTEDSMEMGVSIMGKALGIEIPTEEDFEGDPIKLMEKRSAMYVPRKNGKLNKEFFEKIGTAFGELIGLVKSAELYDGMELHEVPNRVLLAGEMMVGQANRPPPLPEDLTPEQSLEVSTSIMLEPVLGWLFNVEGGAWDIATQIMPLEDMDIEDFWEEENS